MFANLLMNALTILVIPPFLFFMRVSTASLLSGNYELVVDLLIVLLALLSVVIMRDCITSIHSRRPDALELCDADIEQRKKSLEHINRLLIQ